MKEKWDFTEVEFKFLPDGRANQAVALMQEALPRESGLNQKAPVALYDLYLDNPLLTLYHQRCGFRLRFGEEAFKKKGRFKTNFKNDETSKDERWLARREVRTDLVRDELLPLPSSTLPGLGPSLAYQVIAAAGEDDTAIGPVLLFSTHRRYYSMKQPTPGQPDMMQLSIERTVGIDARDLDPQAFLTTGYMDWSAPCHTWEFELCELELTVEGVELADTVFGGLVDRFTNEFGYVTFSKYAKGVEEFGLADPS